MTGTTRGAARTACPYGAPEFTHGALVYFNNNFLFMLSHIRGFFEC